jgi:hypothetical protein
MKYQMNIRSIHVTICYQDFVREGSKSRCKSGLAGTTFATDNSDLFCISTPACSLGVV